MKKHILIAQSGLLVIGLPLLNQSCQQKKEKQHPNILFILSDDHSSQAWGHVYGGLLANYTRTENIEKLASEGAVLENAFCTNSISVPSRATILTGAYAHITGVKTLDDALYPEQDNIAKNIQAAGYQTAIVGKWHLKKEPTGFDHYYVFHDQGEYNNPNFKHKGNWVDDVDSMRWHGDVIEGFSTDIVTDKTIEWIKGRDKDKPFAMFCHFKATHEPWDFPDRLKDAYEGVEFPEPENLLDFGTEQSGRTYEGQSLEEMARRWMAASKDPDSWWTKYPELPFTIKDMEPIAARKKIYQKLVRDYLRCGAVIDENIGRLMKMLNKEGLTENTIVIYVSDQGYFLGEHGFIDKRMMLEESLRMPFIIRYPKEIKPGTRNDDIILNIDFASLLADYTDAESPKLSQGSSFRENLKGNTPEDWRKDMYYRYWTHDNERPAHMGIRNERYKLMFLYGYRQGVEQRHSPSWEFYDLNVDPKENKNEYKSVRYAGIIKEMKEEMLVLRDKYKDKDELEDASMQKIIDKYYW